MCIVEKRKLTYKNRVSKGRFRKMRVLREVITNSQKSDMGSGFGYVEGAIGCTLKEVLDFYVKNNKSWGTVYIYRNNDVIRIFDYDTYNNNVF